MKCDVALPSATQNEIEAADASALVKNGCKYVFEGANMPSNNDAIEIFKNNKVVYFPAKVGTRCLDVATMCTLHSAHSFL